MHMTSFSECFNTILTGNKEESREAARQARKILYSSQFDNKFDAIGLIVENAPKEFEQIDEAWRQENFVMAVSVIFFLRDIKTPVDVLFSWLLNLLTHKSGNIRYAAVKMISLEIWPLTVHIRFPERKLSSEEDRIKPEQADIILRALFISLDGLSAGLWQPKYKKYKYIDSLPASPYKSAQMVLAELEEACGKKYFEKL